MERYESITDAREHLSYVDEDLAEAREFIEDGDREMALNIIEAMTRDFESAVKQFPALEAEVKLAIAKITIVAMRLAFGGK